MPSAPTNIPSPENSDDDDDFSEMHTQKRRSHAQPLVLTMDKLKDYPWERPKYTLRVLIQAAILSSAGNQLVLSDIQDAIAKKYPFYQRTKKWRASIRHVLSLKKEFARVPKPVHEPGNGNYWTFVTGVTGDKRQRKRGKGRKAARNASPAPSQPQPPPPLPPQAALDLPAAQRYDAELNPSSEDDSASFVSSTAATSVRARASRTKLGGTVPRHRVSLKSVRSEGNEWNSTTRELTTDKDPELNQEPMIIDSEDDGDSDGHVAAYQRGAGVSSWQTRDFELSAYRSSPSFGSDVRQPSLLFHTTPSAMPSALPDSQTRVPIVLRNSAASDGRHHSSFHASAGSPQAPYYAVSPPIPILLYGPERPAQVQSDRESVRSLSPFTTPGGAGSLPLPTLDYGLSPSTYTYRPLVPSPSTPMPPREFTEYPAPPAAIPFAATSTSAPYQRRSPPRRIIDLLNP